MQFNTFISSSRDLERCTQAPHLREVLLEPALLARQGKLSESDVHTLAIEAQQRGLRPVLVWDILMPERVLSMASHHLQQWNLQHFAAVRVSDVGAAEWLRNHVPKMPLQLIAETGNHNLEALRGWGEIFADTLERLVLSIELPETQLVEYCQALPIACEVLGVGPILLFYSPRSLLSAHLPMNPQSTEFADDESNIPYLETTVAFEETPQRAFPTVETAHGTQMFLDKDQFILDRLEPLKTAGLHTVRLDLRHFGQDGDVAIDIDRICQQIVDDPVTLRKNWAREARAPFFNANRTTSLFSRMKSKLDAYSTPCRLAEAIAAEKGKYTVFYSQRSFEISEITKIALPTGEELDLPPDLTFYNLAHDPIEAIAPEQLIITHWIKKVVPGSLLLGKC